ncbi:hypothetical protein QBC34DRAFT_426424 [Podospora aff. communis PSN243]|uniref:Uncharacterized protein n=1 Tax=Podospora aff. communis PSN243 TaxID=3040156 RepID=A0AAV9GM31_9PEZI|nr:hypothetical protein QBC34DRAFT_426424 [Podospora aff. communis PSN243]
MSSHASLHHYFGTITDITPIDHNMQTTVTAAPRDCIEAKTDGVKAARRSVIPKPVKIKMPVEGMDMHKVTFAASNGNSEALQKDLAKATNGPLGLLASRLASRQILADDAAEHADSEESKPSSRKWKRKRAAEKGDGQIGATEDCPKQQLGSSTRTRKRHVRFNFDQTWKADRSRENGRYSTVRISVSFWLSSINTRSVATPDGIEVKTNGPKVGRCSVIPKHRNETRMKKKPILKVDLAAPSSIDEALQKELVKATKPLRCSPELGMN